MKDRKEKLGLVMIGVSGFVMYMLLAIFFWMEATAAPLEAEQDMMSLGYIYDQHKADEFFSFTAVYFGIMSAMSSKAITDCTTDGEIDFSCADTRNKMIGGYLVQVTENVTGKNTRRGMVDVFWQYAVDSKYDRDIPLATALAVFVNQIVLAVESES